jgi:hypothetical protein
VTSLQGKLEVFAPVDVMQFLGFCRARGALHLRRGEQRFDVFFEEGRITGAVGGPGRPRLGEILRENNVITEDDLEGCLADARLHGLNIGQALLKAGVLTHDELEEALEDQVMRTVFELLKWNEGVFEFRDGVGPGSVSVALRTPLHRLLFEGLKRLDEEAGKEGLS